jgi:7-cyano-7-deazaguanine synthase in queuosine biosynthesis
MRVGDISIDIKGENIGLCLSGGADSSLLAYILMQNTKSPIHFFTFANKVKNRATIYSSVNVIDKCIDLTKNSNVFHHIIYVEEHNRDYFYSYLEDQLKKTVDIVYTATTNVPSSYALANFSSQLSGDILRSRNPSVIKNCYTHKGKIYHPFMNINKKDIKKMYEELNILESVFPLSRSCESFELLVGHCGTCWWCEERFWAFSRLT